IASRASTQPGLAFTCKTDAGPILHSRRNVHRERALTRDAAAAATDFAGIVDHLPTAMAGRAGAFECEEALCMADFSDAATGPARLRLGPSLGTSARAGFASYRGWNADLGRLAGEGFLQGDFHIVAQVRASLTTRTAAARGPHAENTFKNVGKSRAEIGAKA